MKQESARQVPAGTATCVFNKTNIYSTGHLGYRCQAKCIQLIKLIKVLILNRCSRARMYAVGAQRRRTIVRAYHNHVAVRERVAGRVWLAC